MTPLVVNISVDIIPVSPVDIRLPDVFGNVKVISSGKYLPWSLILFSPLVEFS